MVKILMYGCCGHMGQVISGLAANDPEVEIVAGVDIADKGNTSYPYIQTFVSVRRMWTLSLIFHRQRQWTPFWITAEKKDSL